MQCTPYLSLTAQCSRAAEKPSANRVKTEGPSVSRADASYAYALFLSLMRASPHPAHINRNDPPPPMQAHACMQHHDLRAGRAQGGYVVDAQHPGAWEKKKSRKAAPSGGSMETHSKFVLLVEHS